MNFDQESLLSALQNPLEKSLYLQVKEALSKAVEIQQLLIKASQKILYDEEQSQTCVQSITKLYNEAFGVEYIGEMPISEILKKSSQKGQQSLLLKAKTNLNKRNSNELKILDIDTNRKYYDLLNVSEQRVLYKTKYKNKYFMIDLSNHEIFPNRDTISLLFSIYNSIEREQFSEEVLKLSQVFIFFFQKKVELILKKFLDVQDLSLQDIVVKDKPLLTLLVNRIYHNVEKINRRHRRILYSIKAIKHNYATALFANNKLIYNSLGYYLDDDVKKQIVEDEPTTLQSFLDTLSFYEQEVSEILKNSENNGVFQPSSRKWKISVDNSIGFIEFVFHKDVSQSFGCKEKDDRAVLDLYAMGGRKSDMPVDSMRNLSVKNLKSQKTLKSQKILSLKQKQTENESVIVLHNNLEFSMLPVSHIDFESFEFNILEFDIPTTASLSFELLYQRFSSMNLNESKLKQFVKQIGSNYNGTQNAFHNIFHAFNVLHGAYTITKSEAFNELFDEETTLTYLIAAYSHDVCHSGATNFFQQKIVSKLANRYGDISILENNSIATTFKILAREQADFMSDLPEKSWKSFRKLLVESILATDNKNHLQVLTNFQSSMNEKAENLEQDDVHKLIGGLLHTVDFWGTIKDFKVSYAWSKMINIEFQNQYKQEAILEIEQTPYFKDLDNIRVLSKNQQVFISAIVSPLYKKVNEWSRGFINLALQRIDENIVIWKKLESGEDQVENYL